MQNGRPLLFLMACVLSLGSQALSRKPLDCPARAALLVRAVDSAQFQKLWLQYADRKNYSKLPGLGNTVSEKYVGKFQTDTGLKISPDKNTCSKMIDSLNPFLGPTAVKKWGFTPAEQRFLQAVQDEAIRQGRAKSVSYDNYINLAYFFTVAMTLKSQKQLSPRSKRAIALELDPNLIDPDLPRTKWTPDLKRMVEQAPRILFVATFTDLAKQDQNDLRPYPVFYLGLTTEPFILNDFPSPELFFMHDVDHAIRQATDDIKDLRKFRGTPEEWLAKRIAFRDSFDGELKKVPDESLRKVIQEGWYEIFHELAGDIPFTKDGLKIGLVIENPPTTLVEGAHAMKGLSAQRRKRLALEAVKWLEEFAGRP